MKKMTWMIISVLLGIGTAMADYVSFIGQNSNSNAPVGSLATAANWDEGVLPSGSSTGLVTTTAGVTFGGAWYDLAVRQTGGFVDGTDKDAALRGGTSGSGITTIYEIEDSRLDYSSYTNACFGKLTMWSHQGNPMIMNLFSGTMVVTNTFIFSASNGTLNMKDGRLVSATTALSAGRLNMLAGGSGNISMGQITTSFSVQMNFESGNSGSITIDKTSAGEDFGYNNWNFSATQGKLLVDGVAVGADWRDYFELSNDGKTISLSSHVWFKGQNSNLTAPDGALNIAANWEDGVLPSGSSTGLLWKTGNVWFGAGGWYNLAVRQTGGFVNGTGSDAALRGGTSGSGITTIYEIDDIRTEYSAYTNAVFGKLGMWSHHGNPIVMNLLSGTVVVTNNLSLNASVGTLNMKDGILSAATTALQAGRINMLAGGYGNVSLGQITSSFLVNMNFESGNSGSVTIDKTSAGADFGYHNWNFTASQGHLMIDGTAVGEDWATYFDLSTDGHTISLRSEPASSQDYYDQWADGYGVTGMTDDPDEDRFSNLAEYGVGGNPIDGSYQGIASETSAVDVGGTNWFEYVHVERSDAAGRGLSYWVERTSDLLSPAWTNSGIVTVGSGVLDADFNTVTNRVPADSEEKLFLRLRVQLQ